MTLQSSFPRCDLGSPPTVPAHPLVIHILGWVYLTYVIHFFIVSPGTPSLYVSLRPKKWFLGWALKGAIYYWLPNNSTTQPSEKSTKCSCLFMSVVCQMYLHWTVLECAFLISILSSIKVLGYFHLINSIKNAKLAYLKTTYQRGRP